MLRVSRIDAWLNRSRAVEPARPPVRTRGECVIARHGRNQDGRRGDLHPGVSGPSSGAQPLRLHLVLLPPGTRGMPHFHADHEAALYVVSGAAEVWHGTGLGTRSAVRAGDFIFIPPGTPHLAVNRGDVTAIAVTAHSNPGEETSAVVIELPRHLASLASLPVAIAE